jgi:2'-5' RNA ligase
VTTDRWRCFVAAPLTEAVRSELVASVAGWRGQPPANDLRWAAPDGWHLTLAFIGSVPRTSVDELLAPIARVARAHRPTHVETGRLGAFHRPGSARVLWYGVADPDGALAALAADLAGALGLEGGPFRAHITLARARRRPVDLRGWIDEASLAAPSGILEVGSIELVRSDLGAGPARYETLASFDLGGAA